MLLKQIVAAFILLIFLAQTFSNAIIVADYYLNTASFAINCENKNNPQLHCNGQCQMVKQLEKEENSGKPFNTASKEKNELQLFCNSNINTDIFLNLPVSTVYEDLYHFTMQECITTFFHPPSVA